MSAKISFYLYLPTASAAQRAASELERDGYAVNVRLGATGGDWLALATKEGTLSPSELTKVEESLSGIASRLNGEYDGYERDPS
jgi:hypothetical protein